METAPHGWGPFPSLFHVVCCLSLTVLFSTSVAVYQYDAAGVRVRLRAQLFPSPSRLLQPNWPACGSRPFSVPYSFSSSGGRPDDFFAFPTPYSIIPTTFLLGHRLVESPSSRGNDNSAFPPPSSHSVLLRPVDRNGLFVPETSSPPVLDGQDLLSSPDPRPPPTLDYEQRRSNPTLCEA